MQPTRGDVVRTTDPFKLGTDIQRPWLVLSTDRHPFASEQCIAVAVSTKQYDDSIALPDESWVTGGVPEPSFVSPWAVHSPRLEDVDVWQGRVVDAVVDRVALAVTRYIGISEPGEGDSRPPQDS